MPDEFEAEAIARRVREDLEHQLFNAQQRVPGAESRAGQARDAIEANQRQKLREQEEAAAAARRADGQDMELIDGVMFAVGGQVRTDAPAGDGDTIGFDPPLPPPDQEVVDKANAAEREAEAARAEVARLREQIDNLPPAEDILSEIDDVNPDWGGTEAAKKYRSGGSTDQPPKPPETTRIGYSTGGLPPKTSARYDEGDPGPYDGGGDLGPVRGGPFGMGGYLGTFGGADGCLRAGGLVSTVAGAVLLLFSVPIFDWDVTPGGEPGASPPRQSPAVQTPAVASPPAQSPPATGVTGTALGLTDFTKTGGTCAAESFRVGFALEANAGALMLHQLGQTEHASTGTVSDDGDWEATGDGQSYRGRMYGSYIGAVYMDDFDCTYDVRGWLTRMLTEPAPFNTAPGYFEFGDLQTNRFGLGILDLRTGVMPHVIVASDDVDVRTRLPITVVLSVDGVEVSRFVIEGAPGSVCRNATGCSADAPFERMARWSEPNVRLLLTATGADGQLIAAHAPNGLPAGAVAGLSPSPAPTAVPSPSPAPTPTPSPVPTTPPVATVGRGVNVPLAGLGAFLLIAGLAMLAGRRLIGGPPGTPRKPPPPGGVTPPPPTPPPTPGTPPPATAAVTTSGSQDARRDEIESKARKLEEEAARLATELETQRQRELKPIDFDEAFTDTVHALSGVEMDSRPPEHWFESTEKEIARLRAEAAALRAQL